MANRMSKGVHLSNERFLRLLDLLAEVNPDTNSVLHEGLFAVSTFNQLVITFQGNIFRAASQVSGKPLETLTLLTTLAGLNFTVANASQWATAFTNVSTQYEPTTSVSRGECIDMDTLEDAVKLLRSKVKLERLYLLAQTKMWVKGVRGNQLPGPWTAIKETHKLDVDLGVSSQQIDLFAKVATRLCQEFKSTIVVSIQDVRNDDVGSKTIGECADYLLKKVS